MRAWRNLLGAIVLVVSPMALANPLKGRLTPIDFADCRALSAPGPGKAWVCPGLPEFPVYVAERGGRYMMSFGPAPDRRRSAKQSLKERNTIFDGKTRPTVEWRILRLGEGREMPFATIVRYHAQRAGRTREVLVITKVDGVVSCRLARIDATATPEPMALARRWADDQSRRRGCPDKPLQLGTRADQDLWPD